MQKTVPITIGRKRKPLSVDLWMKEVFIQKMEYIHNNPVAAGLCVCREDDKYSSAKFYVTGEDEFGIITHRMAWYCCW